MCDPPSFELIMTPPQLASATTLDELRALHDQRFLNAVYQAILGRAPDPGGLTHYLSRLRSGFPRNQIPAELGRSSEARMKMSAVVKRSVLDSLTERQSESDVAKMNDILAPSLGSSFLPATPAELEQLSPQARSIYFQLKKASTFFKD
jgi:hypothetical protein